MKKFLTAFAAVAAGFASQASMAAVDPGSPNQSHLDETKRATSNAGGQNELVSVADRNGEEFNFILKRAPETGALMAFHSSHSSHRSHSSHSSHYSSRY